MGLAPVKTTLMQIAKILVKKYPAGVILLPARLAVQGCPQRQDRPGHQPPLNTASPETPASVSAPLAPDHQLKQDHKLAAIGADHINNIQNALPRGHHPFDNPIDRATIH